MARINKHLVTGLSLAELILMSSFLSSAATNSCHQLQLLQQMLLLPRLLRLL